MTNPSLPFRRAPTLMASRLAGAAALVLALAACSEDPGVGLPAGGSPTAGGTPSGVQPTVDDEPTVVDDSPTPVEGADVTLANFTFVPDEIEAESGDELVIANTAADTPHTFTVPDTELDVVVQGDVEAEVPIDLEPGDYEVICRFHVGQGMRTTLTVG